MKAKIIAFLDGLILYDYILFGSVFALFLLFIILAILLRHRFKLALFCVLFGFTLLLVGPTLGYIELHHYLFKNSVTLISQKKLHFSEAVVVKGVITNESKFDFKTCKIQANIYKITPNKYKNYIYKLKPFQKMSIVQKDILKNESRAFKMIIEPFRYKKDYNISLKADCQ